jgi:2-haloacid dehalogenase
VATRETLAFDVYGTLVDPIRLEQHLEAWLPGEGRRVSQVWRQTQLEYTWRLTAMGQYQDFAWVTHRALEHALETGGHRLTAAQREAMVARYDHLACFDDVVPGLLHLGEAGYPMVVFSNGTPRMLEALLVNTNLGQFFAAVVSVDEVRAFKPSPRVYQHLARRLDRPLEEIRLITSNGFDVIGAAAAGMRVAWVNRSDGPYDRLAAPPALTVPTLMALAGALSGAQGGSNER